MSSSLQTTFARRASSSSTRRTTDSMLSPTNWASGSTTRYSEPEDLMWLSISSKPERSPLGESSVKVATVWCRFRRQ